MGADIVNDKKMAVLQQLIDKMPVLLGAKDLHSRYLLANDYWKTATIAELLLIQKKYKEAGEMYRKAIAMAPNESGSHESTFTQAKRLTENLQSTEEEKAVISSAFTNLESLTT